MATGQATDVVVERIVAELIDLFVTLAATLVVVFVGLLAVGGLGVVAGGPGGPGGDPGAVVGALGLIGVLLVALVVVVVTVGYSMVLEVVWDGQTVGKRIVGIRVVETDGSVPGVVPVVVRNLPAVFAAVIGAVLVYPIILPVGLAAILVSDDDQRLFDVLAGTLVVGD